MNFLWWFRRRTPLTEGELLQHQPTLVHGEAQRQDARNRAANRASVAHKWPRMASWIVERRESANRTYQAEKGRLHATAVFEGMTAPWED